MGEHIEDIILRWTNDKKGVDDAKKIAAEIERAVSGVGSKALKKEDYDWINKPVSYNLSEVVKALGSNAEKSTEEIKTLGGEVANIGKQGAYGQTDFFSQLGASATAAAPKIDMVSKSIAGLGKSALPAGRSWVGDLDEIGKDFDTFSQKYVKAKPQIEAYIKSMGFRKTGEHVPRVMREINDLVQETGMSFENATKQVTGFDENLNKTGETIAETGETAKKAGRNIYALIGGFGSFFLSFAGKDITKFGTAILSPLTKFIALEQGSGVGAQWANAMKRVENSFTRIGAVMAQTLMPALEKAADLAEKVANFAEANPGIVNAALTLGVGALALGKVLSVLASIGMLFSAGITLGAVTAPTAGLGTTAIFGMSLSAMGAGLGSAMGAAFLLVVLPALAAVFAKWVINQIQKATGAKETSWEEIGTTSNQINSLINPISTLSFILKGLGADEASKKLWNLNLRLHELGNTADKSFQDSLSPGAVEAYAQYEKQRVAMEQQYEEQRTQIVADAGAARVALEAQYEQERSSIIANYATQSGQQATQYYAQLATLEQNFNQARIDALAEYQASIAKLQEDFRAAEKEAAQEHRDRLQKLLQEHNDRVEQLTNARDALGLAQENRDYKRKVAEENKEYREDQARRRAEYKRQLAELQRQYALQEAQRKREYEEQREEAKRNYAEQGAATAQAMQAALLALDKKHQEEEKKNKETEKKQLTDLEIAHNKQERELKISLRDQLYALGVFHGTVKSMYEAFYDNMEIQLAEFIRNMEAEASGASLTGTSGMAQKLSSGKLSSGSFAGKLARAGAITVNQTLRFSGELGASDKRHIQRIAKESAINGVLKALGA